MRRFLRWLIGIPVVVIVVAFAVANRRWETLSFDPFSTDAPFAAIDLPLWLLFFVGIFVGILVGWISSWLAQGKWRKAARESRSEVSRLNRELSELQRQAPVPVNQDVTPFNGGFL